VADAYVEVPVITDEETLADNATQRLVDEWDDWEPNEGDLEVVLIEAIAQMASDVAEATALMPDAAFHTMLALFDVNVDDGKYATTTVTFTMVDATPQVIPGGTEIAIDDYAFVVDDDMPVSALTLAGVPVTAAELGTGANGLPGDSVTMLSALTFVVSVSMDALPAGGTDPEEESAFLDRGSRELELLARTLVTGRDYELMALTNVPAVGRIAVVANQATRVITVTASTAAGNALAQTDKDTLTALYNEYRQTTWTVTIADAAKTSITVTFQIHVYPTFVAQTVIDEAEDLVTAYLDPAAWGVPDYALEPSQVPTLVEPRVRKNKLIDLIGNANGVDYVVDVTISGAAGTLQSNGDWLMPGTVPLPQAGSVVGTAV
jgi:hypothetical protein